MTSGTIPLKYQIAEKIKKMIQNNELKPGDTVPSEAELCDLYKVSRTTVIAALQILQNESYIHRQQGKGTFVSPKKLVQDLSASNTFFGSITSNKSVSHSSKILQLRTVNANLSVAEKLGIPEFSKVVFIKRLRIIDGNPIAIMWSHIKWEYGSRLLQESLDDNFSIYSYMRDAFLQEPNPSPIILTVGEYNSEDAHLIGLEKGAVCCRTESTSLIGGTPFEFAHTVMRADKFEFVIKIISFK